MFGTHLSAHSRMAWKIRDSVAPVLKDRIVKLIIDKDDLGKEPKDMKYSPVIVTKNINGISESLSSRHTIIEKEYNAILIDEAVMVNPKLTITKYAPFTVYTNGEYNTKRFLRYDFDDTHEIVNPDRDVLGILMKTLGPNFVIDNRYGDERIVCRTYSPDDFAGIISYTELEQMWNNNEKVALSTRFFFDYKCNINENSQPTCKLTLYVYYELESWDEKDCKPPFFTEDRTKSIRAFFLNTGIEIEKPLEVIDTQRSMQINRALRQIKICDKLGINKFYSSYELDKPGGYDPNYYCGEFTGFNQITDLHTILNLDEAEGYSLDSMYKSFEALEGPLHSKMFLPRDANFKDKLVEPVSLNDYYKKAVTDTEVVSMIYSHSKIVRCNGYSLGYEIHIDPQDDDTFNIRAHVAVDNAAAIGFVAVTAFYNIKVAANKEYEYNFKVTSEQILNGEVEKRALNFIKNKVMKLQEERQAASEAFLSTPMLVRLAIAEITDKHKNIDEINIRLCGTLTESRVASLWRKAQLFSDYYIYIMRSGCIVTVANNTLTVYWADSIKMKYMMLMEDKESPEEICNSPDIQRFIAEEFNSTAIGKQYKINVDVVHSNNIEIQGIWSDRDDG